MRTTYWREWTTRPDWRERARWAIAGPTVDPDGPAFDPSADGLALQWRRVDGGPDRAIVSGSGQHALPTMDGCEWGIVATLRPLVASRVHADPLDEIRALMGPADWQTADHSLSGLLEPAATPGERAARAQLFRSRAIGSVRVGSSGGTYATDTRHRVQSALPNRDVTYPAGRVPTDHTRDPESIHAARPDAYGQAPAGHEFGRLYWPGTVDTTTGVVEWADRMQESYPEREQTRAARRASMAVRMAGPRRRARNWGADRRANVPESDWNACRYCGDCHACVQSSGRATRRGTHDADGRPVQSSPTATTAAGSDRHAIVGGILQGADSGRDMNGF